MKKFLFIISLTLSATTFANTVSIYRFDDVDVVKANGKIVSVEDLRDGFITIKGIQVSEETVTVTSESKALIFLRNSTPNNSSNSTTMAVRTGGDMGGG